jgi:hypothetical protein
MKKSILFSIIACLFIIATQAQTKVTLTFTGQLQDGSHIQLDSVQVYNITQSWSETLFYPDTILEMETEPVSIATFENKGLELSSATPNPFNGTTDISLQLPKDETVQFSLYDINGKEYLSKSLQLESGKHQLKLSTVTPQIYFLQVKTSFGSSTIKLLNQSKGTGFDITHSSSSPLLWRGLRGGVKSSPSFGGGWGEVKLATTNTFVANDNFLFIGYHETDTVQIRVQQPASNTTYTFNYQIGYKIGDVYYKDGIAEGMVWWLADTILMVDTVAYGQHGKLIALTEPGIPVNQRGQMWGVGSLNVIVPAYDTIDGRINTPIIKHIRDSLANDSTTIYGAWRFQAMSWCVDSLGGDWYLPAINELRNIIELVVPVLNPALEKIAGAKKLTWGANSIYWSSTADETDSRNAYAMQWGFYPDDRDFPDYRSGSFLHNTYGSVRAVRWF